MVTDKQKIRYKKITGHKYPKVINPDFGEDVPNYNPSTNDFGPFIAFIDFKDDLLELTLHHRMTSETVYLIKPNGIIEEKD